MEAAYRLTSRGGTALRPELGELSGCGQEGALGITHLRRNQLHEA